MQRDAGRAGKAGRARVILGASCYTDAEAALVLAMELARQLGAELQGVFVRETAVLAAGYAHSRAVSYSGQRETGLTGAALAKAFQADARRFRGLLSARAAAAALESSFREAEGHVQEELRRVSQAGDILIFGFKPILRAAGRIAVILAAGQGVPDYTQRLARKAGKPLVALVACPAGAEPVPAPAGQEDSGLETRFCAQPEALLRQLEHMNPAAVIVAAPLADLPPATRIQDAARCPLILQTGG
ncbi:hypothetical protein K3555_22715 (plasmid) [Leisingera sp. M527]|uniref:hypothetical protein n=1 Tax=Leisingera sp. M527 TaxID=2867014 RepID=UPI0021A3A80E|nr:hypothetical protein [Leisingera sp. M527]UWQ35343.1 hypothetical protein K3555_22715 [Leisingera sp. M527]